MNERIEQVLRALLTNVQVLTDELERLARDDQLSNSLAAARLLKQIGEAFTEGAQLVQQISRG